MKERLPKVPGSHVQSADSELALRQIIRPPIFLIREQTPDYGVDFLAEVLTDDQEATNWLLPIQLRSEGIPRVVDNGNAVSVVFKTSPLNYLFRWLGRSLVVAYNANDGVLLWEWTDNVVAALDADGRNWQQRGTVSVRVPTRNVLDAASADVIRHEVLTYYQRATAANQGFLAGARDVSATAGDLSGSRDAVAAIRKDGPALVSAGLHREVLGSLQRVPEIDWIADHCVVLTVAFAYERSGSPLQALYYANVLPGDPTDLDPNDCALLAHIRSNARLALGQIDSNTYAQELTALAERFPHSLVAVQAQLHLLARAVILAPRQTDRRDDTILSILRRARSLLEGNRERAGPHRAALWALETLLARVEMEAVDRLLLSCSYRMRLAESLGVAIPLAGRSAMALNIADVALAAAARLERVMKAARESGAAEWAAIAQLTFLEANVKRSGLFVAIGVTLSEPFQNQDRRLLEQTVASAEELAVQFAASDHQGLAFRAKRLQGEALAVLGNEEAAAAARRDLERWAGRLGIRPDAATVFGPPRPPRDSADQQTLAQTWVDAAPEMLKRLEDDTMHTLGLPESRRPALARDVQAMRRVSREKLDFCRHLEVLQDLGHTQSAATYYDRDPARVGRCSCYGYEAKIESTDVDAVVNAFKKTYCHECPSREPFVPLGGR